MVPVSPSLFGDEGQVVDQPLATVSVGSGETGENWPGLTTTISFVATGNLAGNSFASAIARK